MRWSLKLGSVAGIGIYVHWTFLLLVAWIVWLHHRHGDSAMVTLEGVAFILALFGCIVLHELGHALTARHFEIQTRDITLLPIGGVARLERIPEIPIQELWVALAGPAVNIAIAAVLFAMVGAAALEAPANLLSQAGGEFLAKLLWVNIALVVFNMIPAFPMDGGRVLRAVLALRLDYSRATQAAAIVGQAIAIGFGILGLFYNPFLLFIAIFVFLGAQQEAHATALRSALAGVPVRDAMIVDFRTLASGDTLDVAVEALRSGTQHDFPVVEGGAVVGLLTRDDVLRALAHGGAGQPVTEWMGRDCLEVRDDQMLSEVLRGMREHQCSALAVVRDGRVVGLLTLENVGKLMLIHSAASRGGGRRPAP